MPINVKWDKQIANLTEKEKMELFVPMTLSNHSNYEKSVFSSLVVNGYPKSDSQFSAFIPYDGRFVSINDSTRNMTIFVMPTEEIENKPDSLTVSVINTATIYHLIGVVLNQLECEYNLVLNPNISMYELYFADNGHTETSLPAIKKSNLVKSCKFRELSLLKKEFSLQKNTEDNSVVINWNNFDYDVESLILYESIKIMLFRFISTQLKIQNFDLNHFSLYYYKKNESTRLEYLTDPDDKDLLDLTKSVSEIDFNRLILIRAPDDKCKGFLKSNEEEEKNKGSTTHQVLCNQIYRVKILDRFVNYEVSLTILYDSLLITPMEKSFLKFNKPKSQIIIYSKEIEECRIIGNQNTGKNHLKVIHLKYRKYNKNIKVIELEIRSSDAVNIVKSFRSLVPIIED